MIFTWYFSIESVYNFPLSCRKIYSESGCSFSETSIAFLINSASWSLTGLLYFLVFLLDNSYKNNVQISQISNPFAKSTYPLFLYRAFWCIIKHLPNWGFNFVNAQLNFLISASEYASGKALSYALQSLDRKRLHIFPISSSRPISSNRLSKTDSSVV